MAEKIGRVLVLGAYGFIGAEVVRSLQTSGFAVTGLGRSAEQAARVLPGVPFVAGNLLQLLQPEDWTLLLQGVDAVVNCAGVLQDMAPGELEAVHHLAIAALAAACADRGTKVVQVSAAGAGPGLQQSSCAARAGAMRPCGPPERRPGSCAPGW
ncbi:NAD(P)H-binding protein [Leisingera sp. NJS201]|uniref:NAD(P)H-binding protein n=1 Tax=Leisingera sp. NJS201 TaxID=2508306 RepID=UPI0020C77611|nr:NAD(P)H-binding protein [Leisingera sp. NJS201]